MTEQPTDQESGSILPLVAALVAFAVAAAVVTVNPASGPSAAMIREKAQPVAGTGPVPISAMAASIGFLFAGSPAGPVYAVRNGQEAIPAAKKILEAGEVTALLLTDQGLWTALAPTKDGKPARLALRLDPVEDSDKDVAIVIPELLAGGQITSLASGLGRLWVGSTKGLFSYDWSRWSQHQPPSRFAMPSGIQGITSLYLDAHGVLWVGTERGLVSYNGTEMFPVTKVEGVPDDPVTTITGDNRGTIVCGTSKGLYVCERGVWVRQSDLREPVTAALIVGESLWVATEKTFRVKDQGQWVDLKPNTDLEKRTVTALAYGGDRIHVGTTEGLFYIPAVPVLAGREARPASPPEQQPTPPGR